jgi:hypothetical protein
MYTAGKTINSMKVLSTGLNLLKHITSNLDRKVKNIDTWKVKTLLIEKIFKNIFITKHETTITILHY